MQPHAAPDPLVSWPMLPRAPRQVVLQLQLPQPLALLMLLQPQGQGRARVQDHQRLQRMLAVVALLVLVLAVLRVVVMMREAGGDRGGGRDYAEGGGLGRRGRRGQLGLQLWPLICAWWL